MMIEYIDREKLLEIIAISKCDSRKTTCDKCDEKAFCIYGVVENFPAEDVAPVVYGEWKLVEPESGVYQCSECSFMAYLSRCNYCPCCGAKFDLGGDV